MTKPALGSATWRAEVFASPPARDASGRSRPTQRYVTLDPNESLSIAEGGNSAIARSILTTSMLAGLVKRFKMEPFSLLEKEHGVDAVPDVLFETADDHLYVVENKAKMYLTEGKIEKCAAVERVVNNAGLTYLLWTDAWPLGPSVWRLQREMRRLGTSAVPEERITALVEAVSRAPLCISQLRAVGLYREHVLAAVWRGLVHMDFFSEMSDQTLITNDVRSRGFDSALHASVDSHRWWRRLRRA